MADYNDPDAYNDETFGAAADEAFLLHSAGLSSASSNGSMVWQSEMDSMANQFRTNFQFMSLNDNAVNSALQRQSSKGTVINDEAALSRLTNIASSSKASALASGADLSVTDVEGDFNFDAESMVSALDDEEPVIPQQSAHDAAFAAARQASTINSSVSSFNNSSSASIAINAAPSIGAPVKHVSGVMSVAALEQRLRVSAPGVSAAPQSMNPTLAALFASASNNNAPLQNTNLPPPPITALMPTIPPPSELPSNTVDNSSATPAPPATGEKVHTPIYLPLPQKDNKWMSRAEIASVLKAQLSQLQPSDITADDFYYQVHQARKGGHVPSHTVVLPIIDKLHAGHPLNRGADGAPKLPDGTLGRIAASNLRKPKKLMALSGASNNEDNREEITDEGPAKRHMFSGRSIPFLIEEGVRHLMDIEDIDSLLASLPPPSRFEDASIQLNRAKYSEQRANAIADLSESLDLTQYNPAESSSGDHLLFRFSKSRKGRLLIFRSLLLMSPPLTFNVLLILLDDLPAFLNTLSINNETDLRLIAVLGDLLYSMPMQNVNEAFYKLIAGKNVSQLSELIIPSRVGVLLFQILMKKGHEIHQELQGAQSMGAHTPALHQSVQMWRSYYDYFVASTQNKWKIIIDTVAANEKKELSIMESYKKKQDASKEEKASIGPVIKIGKRTGTDDEEITPAATINGVWELIASILSHARPDQRSPIINDLKDVYTQYWKSFNDAKSPVGGAFKFLAGIFQLIDEKKPDNTAPSNPTGPIPPVHHPAAVYAPPSVYHPSPYPPMAFAPPPFAGAPHFSSPPHSGAPPGFPFATATPLGQPLSKP